ncbi:MAG: hypothetical protein R3D71_09075 [Rickettsiales bacterium]
MRKSILFPVLGASLLTSFAVLAEDSANVSIQDIEKECPMEERVTVSVNFKIGADSVTKAKAEYDKRIDDVSKYAKEQKISKIIISNVNYNLRGNNNRYNGYSRESSSYYLDGRATYNLGNSSDAFKLAEFLEKKDFDVRVNYNSNRKTGGNCYKMMKSF